MSFSTFFMSDKRKKNIAKELCIVLFVLLPIILFYLMEWYEHNPFLEVRIGAQIFNILLFEFLAWGLFFLIGSGKWAIRIVGLFSMIFGLINYYVMAFRSTPFVPWDIFSVKTAASVAGNYDFTPEPHVIVVTLLFLGIIIFVEFLPFRWNGKVSARLLAAALSVLMLCGFVNLLQDDEFQTDQYLYPFLFTPAHMTKVNGMAVTFAMNLEYIRVDKPSGYQEQECEEFLKSYEQDVTIEESELPNIIVIMNEAFSDLSVLGEFEATEDCMPFIHSLQQGAENTISGQLNVSVCGGNTANTEFEFLTGNTMAFLPAGSIPYQQYIKGSIPSLASYLNGIGYDTCAMHPYSASGWDRDTVYPWMGFEKTVFFDEYENARRIRKYVSDASNYSNLIKQYENKGHSPIFIFNVTMQNHGGYKDLYEHFPHSITVPEAENQALDQYLSLMKVSDTEFEKLINYFSHVDENTIVVFFGDHQPNDSVAKSVYSGEDEEKRYVVPYVIWANYDIEEATNMDTSANYLAAQVLQAAGVPTSAYQNFLLELADSYPIVSAIKTKSISEDEEALLDYRKMQYYYLFDWEED